MPAISSGGSRLWIVVLVQPIYKAIWCGFTAAVNVRLSSFAAAIAAGAAATDINFSLLCLLCSAFVGVLVYYHVVLAGGS